MSLKIISSSILATSASFFIYTNYHKIVTKADDNVFCIEQVTLEKPARIAVIGTGIGGSSASYFLRKTFGSSIDIDVYEESNRIGGRIRTVELNGHEVEIGGTIIHESNKYMMRFAGEMGLELIKAVDSGRLGIYNGEEFVLAETNSPLFNKIKMLWRYGPISVWNFRNTLHDFGKSYGNLYSLQSEERSFETVKDLLVEMGGERFVNYSQKTMMDVMKENKVGEKLINELITGIIRYVYEQDATVNGFIGCVTMLGGGGNLYSVKGGNMQVCQKLLDDAKVKYNFNKKVAEIQKKKDEISMRDIYLLKCSNEFDDDVPYDAVIVATPLEVPQYYIECDGCLSWPNQSQGNIHQNRVSTIVQAQRNKSYFGYEDSDDLPDAICTTNNDKTMFTSMGFQKNTKGEITNPPIFKIFSKQMLSKETLRNMFHISDKTKVVSASWLACPKYNTPETFTPFKLDQGLFYVNSMERMGSAMETSAIGGRNAALLTKQYLIAR